MKANLIVTLKDGGIEGLLLVFHLLAAGNGRSAPCRREKFSKTNKQMLTMLHLGSSKPPSPSLLVLLLPSIATGCTFMYVRSFARS